MSKKKHAAESTDQIVDDTPEKTQTAEMPESPQADVNVSLSEMPGPEKTAEAEGVEHSAFEMAAGRSDRLQAYIDEQTDKPKDEPTIESVAKVAEPPAVTLHVEEVIVPAPSVTARAYNVTRENLTIISDLGVCTVSEFRQGAGLSIEAVDVLKSYQEQGFVERVQTSAKGKYKLTQMGQDFLNQQ